MLLTGYRELGIHHTQTVEDAILFLALFGPVVANGQTKSSKGKWLREKDHWLFSLELRRSLLKKRSHAFFVILSVRYNFLHRGFILKKGIKI